MPKKHRSVHHHQRPKGVSQRSFERVYWPYLPLIAVIVLVLAFSSLGVRAMTSTGSVLAYASSMSSSGLLANTNQKRANNGAAALTLNGKLSAAAQAKANDMAGRNYWSHNTPEGNPPWVFVDTQGYDYQKIGENLAAGFSNESAVVTGWMNSPAHQANMLDTAFKEVGFGFANNADYTSAGGGPMTIVVAFYGVSKSFVIPTPCPDGQIGSPPNCAPPPSQNTTKPKATPPPASQPTPTPTPPTQQPAPTPKPNPEEPITSDKPVPVTTPTEKTSQLQLVLGSSSTRWATTVAFAVLLLSGCLWITRHVVIARRAVTAGENFVIHHPIVDVALMAIMAVAYLMTRTTGLIQ